jgi:hypothetical protein
MQALVNNVLYQDGAFGLFALDNCLVGQCFAWHEQVLVFVPIPCFSYIQYLKKLPCIAGFYRLIIVQFNK